MRPGLGPVGAVLLTLATGCHAARSTPVTPVPVVRVAAQPFALAEVARRVGGARVAVSPTGDVVLNTGGDPDPWLDPVAMKQVTQRAADALARADPDGRTSYQAAARAYQAQLGALDIDYRSSLADCARHDIVTADAAFVGTGGRYGFTDHPATEPGAADVVRTHNLGVVFTEVGVAPGAVEALAQATHAHVDELDPMTARTPEEQGRGATYLSLMTDNLAKLRAALGCTSGP